MLPRVLRLLWIPIFDFLLFDNYSVKLLALGILRRLRSFAVCFYLLVLHAPSRLLTRLIRRGFCLAGNLGSAGYFCVVLNIDQFGLLCELIDHIPLPLVNGCPGIPDCFLLGQLLRGLLLVLRILIPQIIYVLVEDLQRTVLRFSSSLLLWLFLALLLFSLCKCPFEFVVIIFLLIIIAFALSLLVYVGRFLNPFPHLANIVDSI